MHSPPGPVRVGKWPVPISGGTQAFVLVLEQICRNQFYNLAGMGYFWSMENVLFFQFPANTTVQPRQRVGSDHRASGLMPLDDPKKCLRSFDTSYPKSL
jgi:hypothetical protein